MTAIGRRLAVAGLAIAAAGHGAVAVQPPLLPAPAAIRVGVARAGGGYEVRSIPLETYVGRVLGGEAAPNTAPAALQALAVAIRTYGLVNLGRHGAEGFDLCDQTHCQVVRTANEHTDRAATATSGQVLLRDGRPAPVYYSASCGGRTERPSAVWPGAEDPPYLPVQDDDACRGEPEWTTSLTRDDLENALSGAGFRGRLRTMRIASRNDSGRVARLTLEGLTPSEISAQDLRMAMIRTRGPFQIRSAAFDLRRDGNTYTLSGQGYGHGVGMCVIGAMHLAEEGQSAATILGRYYPGLTIGATSGLTGPAAPSSSSAAAAPASGVVRAPGVLMLVPAGTADAQALGDLAGRARSDVAALLGVQPPESVPVQFHASAADYERASGRPWFTSSAVVNGTIHALPVAVLRDRGVLERSLRREMVRVLIDPVLASRPEWVREGLALHFADPAGAAVDRGRQPCPSDLELQSPTSAGAYAEAAARARACAARQLQSGRSWQEVR